MSMKIKEYLKVLITVQSIIIAGLLAWAQLWVKTYEIYLAGRYPIWTGSISLLAIYVAIMASICAIIFAFIALWKSKNNIPVTWTITFSSFSLIILLTIVITSIMSMYEKALTGTKDWHPFVLANNLDPSWTTISISILGAIILGLLYYFISRLVVKITSEKAPARLNEKAETEGKQIGGSG